MTTRPRDTLLTVKEVAAELNATLMAAYALVYSGKIAATRPAPRKLRIHRRDLDAYLGRRRREVP
jgi:excisionase family DNA binding protein